MKLNVTVFLLKEGRQRGDALSTDSKPTHVEIDFNGSKADFYWKKMNSTPRWAQLFAESESIDTTQMRGGSIQGLLVLERNNRIFCFTFGHARHLIDTLSIERYFGLKVALSLSDPELIKSIDKSTIDKTPLRLRAQSSKHISISEFEFKFDWEILKSLTGVVENGDDEDYEVVSGSDSVSLYTDISLNLIPQIADRLWSAYNDDGYKTKYPWIDYIVPVRDKSVISDLDNLILEKINNKDYNEVWAAPPALIEYTNFSGFCYKRSSGRSSKTTEPDLDLSSCLKAKKAEGSITLSQLKATKVYLYSADYQELDAWPLYICLNGEIEYKNDLYLLSEGDWYQVERDFCRQINQYFENFPHSNISFPNYSGKHEDQYLIEISNTESFHLMDRKLVKPANASSPIEFCDLLTDTHDMIHVKKYSSSSVLSHLFSQAYVSAETLLSAPEVIEQVNNHLKVVGSHKFHFDSKKHPREGKIVLAIMQKRTGDLHMPFFSKVNFKQYSQKLINMGYDVELKKIAL